jgi:hypothetical protein
VTGGPGVIAVAWSLAGSIALAWLSYINLPSMSVSNDGRRYLHAGGGQPVPFPFALRWLLPLLCGTSVRRWQLCTVAHLVFLPPLVTFWMEPWIADERLRIVGGLLVCGFAGIWRTSLSRPVLVDAPAMTWALAAAVLFQHHVWYLGILGSLVAGSIKETAPVFAACYGWNPLALIGLVAPAVRRLTTRAGSDPVSEESLLRDPLRTGRLCHVGRWFDAASMVAPWGAGVLAAFTTDSAIVPILVITVVLAYSQLLLATGTVRLYQWAAPPVVLGAASVIPAGWAFGILVLHQVNPWAGEGR